MNNTLLLRTRESWWILAFITAFAVAGLWALDDYVIGPEAEVAGVVVAVKADDLLLQWRGPRQYVRVSVPTRPDTLTARSDLAHPVMVGDHVVVGKYRHLLSRRYEYVVHPK